MTFPNEELPAARPLKTSPIYPLLKNEGALFGVAFGWEYPLWYAPKGVDPRKSRPIAAPTPSRMWRPR